jgi:primosomal protein N''
MDAEVSVSQAQLDAMVESSIALVKWLSDELYAQERALAANITYLD